METLRDAFRTRPDLPDGRIGAIAAVHTFWKFFTAPDFIAAALLHLPPKSQQTVRYYGTYSNKIRGQTPLIPDRIIRPPESSPNLKSPISNTQSTILLIPAPPKQSARDMRPVWRDLILQVWGGDPLQCPCCKGTMKPVRKVIRRLLGICFLGEGC